MIPRHFVFICNINNLRRFIFKRTIWKISMMCVLNMLSSQNKDNFIIIWPIKHADSVDADI